MQTEGYIDRIKLDPGETCSQDDITDYNSDKGKNVSIWSHSKCLNFVNKKKLSKNSIKNLLREFNDKKCYICGLRKNGFLIKASFINLVPSFKL